MWWVWLAIDLTENRKKMRQKGKRRSRITPVRSTNICLKARHQFETWIRSFYKCWKESQLGWGTPPHPSPKLGFAHLSQNPGYPTKKLPNLSLWDEGPTGSGFMPSLGILFQLILPLSKGIFQRQLIQLLLQMLQQETYHSCTCCLGDMAKILLPNTPHSNCTSLHKVLRQHIRKHNLKLSPIPT